MQAPALACVPLRLDDAISQVPAVRPPFTAQSPYARLSSPTAIRLLNIDPASEATVPISCSFEEFDLHPENHYSSLDNFSYQGYSALSYCWGDPATQVIISINGKPRAVRRNLWDFLIQARDNGWTRRLWTDALCINQDDMAERNAQVQMMNQIYSRANHVLVWLGRLIGDELRAVCEMDLMHKDRNFLLSGDQLMPVDDKFHARLGDSQRSRFSTSAWRGICSLMRNPYWKRRWVIQEMLLSSGTASLVVGNGQIRLSTVASYFATCVYICPAADGTLETFRKAFRTSCLEYLHVNHLSTTTRSRDLSLGQLFDLFSYHECSVPHDYIYSLIGVSRSPDFPVDYSKPIGRLYWEVIRHELGHNHRGCGSFAERLQQSLGLSTDRMLEDLGDFEAGGEAEELWHFQLASVLGKILIQPRRPGTNSTNKWADPSILAQLPVFNLDHRTHDRLTAYSRHIMAVHSSIQGTFGAHGPFLGGTFFAVVSGLSEEVLESPASQQQYQSYNQGTAVLPFPLEAVGTTENAFRCGSLELTDVIEPKYQGRPVGGGHPRPGHVLVRSVQSLQSTEQGRLEKLVAGDVVCMFATHRAAFVLRRRAGGRAICGVAFVRFAPEDGFQVSNSAHITEEEAPRKLELLFQPHSIVANHHWHLNENDSSAESEWDIGESGSDDT